MLSNLCFQIIINKLEALKGTRQVFVSWLELTCRIIEADFKPIGQTINEKSC